MSYYSAPTILFYWAQPINQLYVNYQQVCKLVDTRTVNRYLIMPFITATCLAACFYYADIHTTHIIDVFWKSYIELAEDKTQMQNYMASLGSYVITSMLVSATKSITDYLNERNSIVLANHALAAIDGKLFCPQGLANLDNFKETKSLLPSHPLYIYKTITESSAHLIKFTDSFGRALLSLTILSRKNLILPLVAIAHGFIEMNISFYLMHQISIKYDMKRATEDSLKEIFHQVTNEGKVINLNSAEQSIRQKSIKLKLKLMQIDLAISRLESLFGLWRNFSSYCGIFMRWYSFGYLLADGSIKNDMRATIENAMHSISQLFLYSSNNAGALNLMRLRTANLINILNKLDKLPNHSPDLCFEKNIKPELKIDITLYLKESLLVKTASPIELLHGRTYVILGASGAGKSSFISKLMGLTVDPNVTAAGKISFPYLEHPGRIAKMMITQRDLFPKAHTLLETICIPGIDPRTANREAIIKLMAQIGLSRDIIDELDFPPENLSGGEMKKIKVVSAIINQPQVLILDEIFNGLDHKSVYQIQSIIKEKLPDSIIMVIDHEHESHDDIFNKKESRKFFDAAITFGADKEIRLITEEKGLIMR
jgi:ABC-type Mn2+/Zn2+ transport system ATPase subunit